MYFILFGAIALMSFLVQWNLKNKFEKYGRVPMPGHMTGRDVAEQMLRDNGIYDVRVISTPGRLTDHYNPDGKCFLSFKAQSFRKAKIDKLKVIVYATEVTYNDLSDAAICFVLYVHAPKCIVLGVCVREH